MESKIIQDVSHYQPKIDFGVLASKGQSKIIMKAGSGSLSKDAKFEENYVEAISNGFRVAPYFWHDPIYDPTAQAKFFLDTVKNKNISFIVIDFEQWWADWTKWGKMNKGEISSSAVPVVNADKLLSHFKTVYDYINNNSIYPVVIYTANWYLSAYCPKAFDYLKDKFTHWADYSLFSRTKVSTTWEEIEKVVPVDKKIPTLPASYPLDKVLMWQWSGEKFYASGVYGDEAGKSLSLLDLNLWVNTVYKWETIDVSNHVIVAPVEPEPEVVIEKKEAIVKSDKNVYTLNVPYLSQLGLNADAYNNDCGAACGAMLIKSITGEDTTVDEFYKETGMSYDGYLSASQLINVLSKHNVGSKWTISDMNSLTANLRSGKPVICLINYNTLINFVNTYKKFTGYHFVVVVGYDVKNIYIHDPLWPDQEGKELEVPYDVFEQCWKDAGIDPSKNPAYGCITPNNPIGYVSESTSTTNQKWAVTYKYGLNIRKGPSTSTAIVGGLMYNQEFYVTEISNGWGKIANGYVCLSYAKRIS